jgi:hypothetical protein
MPEQIGMETTTSANQELQKLDELFKAYKWKPEGVTWTALDSYLYSKGITSYKKRQDMIDTCCTSKIIYRNEKKKWFYNGLDKSILNDSPEQLPFSRSSDDDVPY